MSVTTYVYVGYTMLEPSVLSSHELVMCDPYCDWSKIDVLLIINPYRV